MTFSFDSIRNLFNGQRSEQVQPTFTPASGQEVEATSVAIVGSEGGIGKQQIDIAAAHPSSRAVCLNSTVQQSIDRANQLRFQQADLYRDLSALTATDFAKNPNLSIELRSRAEEWNTACAETIERSPRDTYLWFPKPVSEQEMQQLIWDRQNAMEATSPGLSPEQSEPRLAPAFQSPIPEPNEQGIDEAKAALRLLGNQEKIIREEWQQDLQSGHHNQHDLETYFAGKIDQHNTLIELAVEANPKLQETLPPQINYEQLRSEIQHQIQQQIQQQPPTPAQAMEMAI